VTGETDAIRTAREDPQTDKSVCFALDDRQTCLYIPGMATLKPEASVRERLLEAANQLFYEEGVHTVGIDRVLERAGVAKASLYGTFGSKDELVRAYLERRGMMRRARISQRIAQHEEPRAQILAIFDLLAEIAAEPNYRGCAFVNASAEGPAGETGIRQVCASQRGWVRSLFTDLARGAGVRDADLVGRRLALLYDGAVTSSSMDRDPGLAREARAMAEELLDARSAEGAPPKKGPARKESPKRRRRGGDRIRT
jgi:AcrR family transcriptional regulator